MFCVSCGKDLPGKTNFIITLKLIGGENPLEQFFRNFYKKSENHKTFSYSFASYRCKGKKEGGGFMDDCNSIRGPDGAVDKELLDEIRIMIIFKALIEQDMREFIKDGKGPPKDERV